MPKLEKLTIDVPVNLILSVTLRPEIEEMLGGAQAIRYTVEVVSVKETFNAT